MAFLCIRQAAGAFPHGILTRRELERQIEERIALLDLIDSDPDLEPSLCGVSAYALGTMDDREDDAGDDREPDPDFEWSLGSLGNVRQTAWSQGSSQDLEAGI